ncbi:MAG TPA: glycoside hydrolase family 3 N-terminal domain-containing protein [Syntrophobacter fumaroxidans]|nr:glycoside hydrolase family 3 N-terminal domain-containing protein [Syntrophobacter fumaroxidans]
MVLKQVAEAGIHLLVGFQGTTFQEQLKSLIDEFRIGGIVLFRRNIQTPEQLRSLLEEMQSHARQFLGRSLWVAIDQEGGPVQRLVPPFTQLPSACDLAEQGIEAVAEWSSKAAMDLRRMGILINLAPVLDVRVNANSHFMEGRCLGDDPLTVAELGCRWIKTLQGAGISATAKHFPGLGLAELDPHHFAPVIRWPDQEAMQKDLLPFRKAIEAGVHCVMTSHALYPFIDSVWPATLSPAINNDLLRGELGFRGTLLSDDMDMAAVSEKYSWKEMAEQGLLATIDFFLLCQRTENIEQLQGALCAAIAGSSRFEAMHRESAKRIEWLYDRHRMEHQGG